MKMFFYGIITKIIIISYLFSNDKIRNKINLIIKYIYYIVFKPKYINFGGLKFKSFNNKTLLYLFSEIFIRNEYFFECNKPNPVIIDLGVNTGISIMYFKYLFPQSIIYGFEPDEKAFSILKENIENNNLKDVTIFKEGISDKTGELSFYSNSEKDGGSLTMSINKNREENGIEIKIKTRGLLDFINEYKIDNIDLLKIDIEGAEDILFKMDGIDKILNITNKIIMEYHHNIPNTESNLDLVLNKLKNNGFKYQIDSICFPLQSYNKFQDIYIYATKR